MVQQSALLHTTTSMIQNPEKLQNFFNSPHRDDFCGGSDPKRPSKPLGVGAPHHVFIFESTLICSITSFILIYKVALQFSCGSCGVTSRLLKGWLDCGLMVGGTSVAVASTSTSFGSVASKSVSGGILTIVSMAGSRDAWFRLATGIFGSNATAQGGGCWWMLRQQARSKWHDFLKHGTCFSWHVFPKKRRRSVFWWFYPIILLLDVSAVCPAFCRFSWGSSRWQRQRGAPPQKKKTCQSLKKHGFLSNGKYI